VRSHNYELYWHLNRGHMHIPESLEVVELGEANTPHFFVNIINTCTYTLGSAYTSALPHTHTHTHPHTHIHTHTHTPTHHNPHTDTDRHSHTHTHIDTQTKYSNPHCACAPRRGLINILHAVFVSFDCRSGYC